jgi:hypothetical protein
LSGPNSTTSLLIYFAELPRIESEMHNRSGVRREMDALESFKTPERVTFTCGRDQVELGDFIAGAVAAIGDADIGSEWLPGFE